VFERFTDRARQVIVLAQEEARMREHDYLGTEDLLLGLSRQGDGVGAKALEALGITPDVVRERVEAIIGRHQATRTGQISFTSHAKKALEFALRESMQLGQNYIGTEHILLGLVREGEGVGFQVLQSLGAELDRVRQTVVELLSS
jgi:ATP-dependent Clp protease ATP-binding subunit ClpC